MSDLVSNQLRDSVNKAMKDLFDTYSRNNPLRFFRKEKVVYVQDANYSGHWDRRNNNNTKVADYRDFNCVVTFEERQKLETFIQGTDTNIRYKGEYNRIRVRMELDAKEYLKGTERFIFEEVEYAFDGTFRDMAMLKDALYTEIILQRVN